MSDLYRCPMCELFAIRFGTAQRDFAIDAMADHLALCVEQTTEPCLTEQLEREETR